MDVIVYLNGNAYAVALADAEVAGKHHVILYFIFLNSILQKLDDLLRTLEMAGRAYTNLNK